MTRFARYLHGVTSGFAVLVINALFSLASVSLALHFLSKEEFGLWALGAQVAVYLTFVDMGMSASIARLLIDHKDERANGAYGSMIRTALLAFSAQAALILVAGIGVSLVAPTLFRIPGELQREFILLLTGLTVVTAANFVTRIFSQILHAHQRMDIYNYIQIVGLAVNFAVLWLAFRLGAGVFSLLFASAAAWSVSLVCGLACHTLGFWPKPGEWGRLSWLNLREMFVYGMDLFWIALATQMILSSQPLIASRVLGLEAAAIWAVMIKPFTLVSQLVWRPIGLSMPAFAEMQVRGERTRFWERYAQMFQTLTAMSCLGAVLFATCNAPFVAIWTGGKMHWPVINDWLLAVWMILLTQLGAHTQVLMSLKQTRGLKLIYTAEALVFVLVGIAVTRWSGFSGMLVSSIACSCIFSLTYSSYHVMRAARGEVVGILWNGQVPMFRLLATTLPVALLLQWLTREMAPAARLAFTGVPVGIIGSIVLLRHCLPGEFASRIKAVVPRALRPIFIGEKAAPLSD